MSPLPKNRPDENPSSSSADDLSHPSFHFHQEYNASTDESTSSSSDEENSSFYQRINGYSPLNQDSTVNSLTTTNSTENDDEFRRFVLERIRSSIDEIRTHSPLTSTNCDIEAVWSTKSFILDDIKADYIKSLMSAIKLPETSVPLWAQSSSEQEWKEKLREQTTFFLYQRTSNG